MKHEMPNQAQGMIHTGVDQVVPWTTSPERLEIIESTYLRVHVEYPFLHKSVVVDEFERQEELRVCRSGQHIAVPAHIRVRFLQRLLQMGAEAIKRSGYDLSLSLNPQPHIQSYSKKERAWFIFKPECRDSSAMKWVCWKSGGSDSWCQAAHIPVGIQTMRDARLFLHNMRNRRVVWHPTARPNHIPRPSRPRPEGGELYSIRF